MLAIAIAVLVAATLFGGSGEPNEPVRRCSKTAESVGPTAPTVSTPEITIAPSELTAAARSVSPHVRVGAVVVDRVRDAQVLTVNGDRAFQAASLVKLLIALDALSKHPADPDLHADIERMLSESNDAVASQLWVKLGGDRIVSRWAATLRLTGTKPPADPGQWGATAMTPNDVATVYEYILTELADERRELIVTALASAPPVARDGFEQHFGIPSAFDKPWAVKQGWSTTSEAVGVHSTGLIGRNWRYIVVVLTEHPHSVDWNTGAQAVTNGLAKLSPLV